MLPEDLKASDEVKERDLADDSTTGLLSTLLNHTHLTPVPERIDGLLIGHLNGYDDMGRPLVVVPGILDTPQPAQALCPLEPFSTNIQCALMFEAGHRDKPVIMGWLQQPVIALTVSDEAKIECRKGAVNLHAATEINLHCGQASIRMNANGRIELRGTTVVSHSTGLNRIRGAAVKVN